MNFSQRFGLFILIIISLVYVYTSFFNKNISIPNFNKEQEQKYNPIENVTTSTDNIEKQDKEPKTIKIFVIDKSANIRPVTRTCDPSVEKSCFEYAIKELVAAPTRWERSKGFSSEI